MPIKTEIEILEEQIKILESSIIDNPSNISAYFSKGEIKSILGFYLEALQSFEQVINNDPDSLRAYLEIAKIYIYKEMYKDAYEAIKKAGALSAYNVEGFILYKKLKDIFKTNDIPFENIDVYEKFTSSEDEITSFHVSYKIKTAHYGKLIDEYKKILEENPSDIKSEYSLKVLERGLNFNESILNFYDDLKTKVKKGAVSPSKQKSVMKKNAAAEEVLKDFLKLRSVMHATVFDKKGNVVSVVSLKPLYENIDYSRLIESLNYIDKWAQGNEKNPNFISFEFAEGAVFIHELGENYYFISSGEGVINFGSLKYTFDKNRESLLKAL